MDRTTHDYWYTNNVANDFYVSGSDSLSNYTDTIVSCNVSENKLSLRVQISAEGKGTTEVCAISTRADAFYLSGVLAYD